MLNILENEDGFDEEYGLNREGFIIDSTSCGEKDGNFHTEYPLNPSEKNDDFHIFGDKNDLGTQNSRDYIRNRPFKGSIEVDLEIPIIGKVYQRPAFIFSGGRIFHSFPGFYK